MTSAHAEVGKSRPFGRTEPGPAPLPRGAESRSRGQGPTGTPGAAASGSPAGGGAETPAGPPRPALTSLRQAPPLRGALGGPEHGGGGPRGGVSFPTESCGVPPPSPGTAGRDGTGRARLRVALWPGRGAAGAAERAQRGAAVILRGRARLNLRFLPRVAFAGGGWDLGGVSARPASARRGEGKTFPWCYVVLCFFPLHICSLSLPPDTLFQPRHAFTLKK